MKTMTVTRTRSRKDILMTVFHCHGDSCHKYQGISGDIPRGLHFSFVLCLEPNFYLWGSRRIASDLGEGSETLGEGSVSYHYQSVSVYLSLLSQ